MANQHPNGFDDASHKTASKLFLTSMVSSAVFWGLATWGVIDANVNHVPTRIVKTERTLLRERTADVRTPQPQKLGIVPVPAAGGSR